MTTARDRETWNSQKLAVLELLQTGQSITQDEARGQFGIMRLASRVDELRREGWDVVTEMVHAGENGARVARYSLGEEPRRASRFLPVAAENIPDELKALPQWVVWRAMERNGKTTKPPYQIDGRPAKANDPSTWASFENSMGAYEAGLSDGVGFVFAPGGGLVGVDLDGCVGEDGTVAPKAEVIVEALGGYAEYSVSGRGLHIIVRAELEKGYRSGPIEVYPGLRFFTMTGSLYDERSELRANQAAVDGLVRAIRPEKPKGAAATGGGRRYLPNPELIEKAKGAKNGAKFSRLWEGDTSDYNSASEADLALLAMLLYWTDGDEDRARLLFEQSGLCREKWTERADYRRRCFEFLRRKGYFPEIARWGWEEQQDETAG